MMNPLHRVAQRLGLADSPAGAKAKEKFRSDHPEFEASNTQIRATETDRFVVAVFYSGPMPSRPNAYMIYAVSKDLRHAYQLPKEECAPYRIRGLK